MFGFLKGSPASNFKHHVGAMEKQFQKAIKKFIDADQWISGKGMTRDLAMCNLTAQGAVEKAQKRLSEAMWNADDAMKAILKSNPSDKEGLAMELDVASMRYTCIVTYGQFKSDQIEEAFSHSMDKWAAEYKGLKTKYGLPENL